MEKIVCVLVYILKLIDGDCMSFFRSKNILTASCFKYTWQVSLRCSTCVSSSAILQHNKITSNVLLDFVISKTCNPTFVHFCAFPPSLIVHFLPDFRTLSPHWLRINKFT